MEKEEQIKLAKSILGIIDKQFKGIEDQNAAYLVNAAVCVFLDGVNQFFNISEISRAINKVVDLSLDLSDLKPGLYGESELGKKVLELEEKYNFIHCEPMWKAWNFYDETIHHEIRNRESLVTSFIEKLSNSGLYQNGIRGVIEGAFIDIFESKSVRDDENKVRAAFEVKKATDLFNAKQERLKEAIKHTVEASVIRLTKECLIIRRANAILRNLKRLPCGVLSTRCSKIFYNVVTKELDEHPVEFISNSNNSTSANNNSADSNLFRAVSMIDPMVKTYVSKRELTDSAAARIQGRLNADSRITWPNELLSTFGSRSCTDEELFDWIKSKIENYKRQFAAFSSYGLN